jgi:hypothetical protein
MGIDLTPPEWTEEQITYLKKIEGASYHPDKLCAECGAPLGEHIIGGPAPYHPAPLEPR